MSQAASVLTGTSGFYPVILERLATGGYFLTNALSYARYPTLTPGSQLAVVVGTPQPEDANPWRTGRIAVGAATTVRSSTASGRSRRSSWSCWRSFADR